MPRSQRGEVVPNVCMGLVELCPAEFFFGKPKLKQMCLTDFTLLRRRGE